MMIEPRTAEQWQEAVDAAWGALTLEAARTYGLVEGGPAVDEARCLEILQRGAEEGIVPESNSAAQFARGLVEG